MREITNYIENLLTFTWFQPIAVMIGTVSALFFGTWLPLMTSLLICNSVDIVTGLMTGTKHKKLSSRRFYDGLKRKSGMWILIILANIIDSIAFENTPVAKVAMTSYLIGIEGLSILENVGKLGVPIPKWISKFLEQLRDENDENLKK